MGCLPELDLDTAPATKASFERITASRGWVSNLMKAMAHAPEGLSLYAALGHYGRYGTELTEVQRELAICTTVRGVDYGWAHHSGLARQIGVTDAQLTMLKSGRVPDDLGAAERALCAYVLAFSAAQGVPDVVTATALRHFSPRQVTDIALITAYYMAAGALIIGLGVELEPPEVLRTELAWQQRGLAKR